MTESTDPPKAVPVPRGWVPQYLIGSVIVIGLFIGGLFATDHAVGKLVDDLRAAALPSCTGTASPGCRASYPAAVTGVKHGDSTRVDLATSFLADTSARDECFGRRCLDTVRLRSSDGGSLGAGDQVTIAAGHGRILTITAYGETWSTFDDPSISLLNTASSMIWTLYLDAFAVTWLAGYVFMTLSFRVWRIAGSAFRRGLNVVTIASVLGSILTFIAFAFNGARLFVILAAGLLISAGAGALARRHPETRPGPNFVGGKHWRTAMERALIDGCYVLAAFPLPLGLAVAFLLAHDDGLSVGPFIAAIVGVAGAVVIVWRLRRKVASRPRPLTPAGHPIGT